MTSGAILSLAVSIPANTAYEVQYQTILNQGGRHAAGWRVTGGYSGTALTPYSLFGTCYGTSLGAVTCGLPATVLETIVPEYNSFRDGYDERKYVILDGRTKGCSYYIYLYNATTGTTNGAIRLWFRRIK
jgi:hypothetical protein